MIKKHHIKVPEAGKNEFSQINLSNEQTTKVTKKKKTVSARFTD